MSDVNLRPAASRKALRWMMMAGAFAVASAALMISAQAQEAPGAAPLPPGQMMPGRFHHVRMEGHGGGGGMMMFGGSPEQIAHHVDHMLDGLNATDAQRTQIKQIAQAAATDLKTQREAGKSLHERSLQIFSAPTVDANAAEALRQQMEQQHDQASRRVLQAMLDVSRVLTPDQRAKIGERMRQHEAAMQDRMQRMQRERGAPAPKS
ncbi:MAG TPA: Spy/CpxP family protein refolding chaperone [Burkholderiaceae bacterium]|nr:Spy/CpxP family protein refolding chaperone [Burkholderiaceae bacterium]